MMYGQTEELLYGQVIREKSGGGGRAAPRQITMDHMDDLIRVDYMWSDGWPMIK